MFLNEIKLKIGNGALEKLNHTFATPTTFDVSNGRSVGLITVLALTYEFFLRLLFGCSETFLGIFPANDCVECEVSGSKLEVLVFTSVLPNFDCGEVLFFGFENGVFH